jgi:hypothetical protein
MSLSPIEVVGQWLQNHCSASPRESTTGHREAMLSRRTFRTLTQSSAWPTGPSWPGSLPATRTTANSTESRVHLGNVPPASCQLA